MNGQTLAAGFAMALAILGLGCDGASTSEVVDGFPVPDDPVLVQGRAVWLENCENCHGIGKAGSPRFGDHESWAPRLAKGESALLNSALNGFEGSSEGGMPARGGNEDLTDDEVTAAVRYMIHYGRDR